MSQTDRQTGRQVGRQAGACSHSVAILLQVYVMQDNYLIIRDCIACENTYVLLNTSGE